MLLSALQAEPRRRCIYQGIKDLLLEQKQVDKNFFLSRDAIVTCGFLPYVILSRESKQFNLPCEPQGEMGKTEI